MEIDLNIDTLNDQINLLDSVNSQFNELFIAMLRIKFDGVALESASIFNQAKVTVNKVINSGTEVSILDLKSKIEKVRNILNERNSNMNLLFSNLDNINFGEYGNYVDYESNVNNRFGMIYDQTKYTKIPYSGGTLATNGCGFFSLLSVITVKTGHEFSYEEIEFLAKYIDENDYGMSNDLRMELLADFLSDEYKFTWKKGPISELKTSLSNGKAVIGLTPAGKSNSGHFVPITGILENGNVIINDTNGYSYYWDPIKQKRVDEVGFNLEAREFIITPRASDQNGDGLDDDVWYFNFNKNSSIGIEV